MLHALSLGLVLLGLWLVLSGLYQPLLLFLGLVSVAWVVRIALRMEVVDHEGHPLQLRFIGLVGYWLWLMREVALSSVEVARIIVDPRRGVSPVVVRVPASQRTTIGLVTYANSITLTPGTVSIDLSESEGEIIVHALTREAAESLRDGEMDRRVCRVEGVH